jgi:hypothetical protein
MRPRLAAWVAACAAALAGGASVLGGAAVPDCGLQFLEGPWYGQLFSMVDKVLEKEVTPLAIFPMLPGPLKTFELRGVQGTVYACSKTQVTEDSARGSLRARFATGGLQSATGDNSEALCAWVMYLKDGEEGRVMNFACAFGAPDAPPAKVGSLSQSDPPRKVAWAMRPEPSALTAVREGFEFKPTPGEVELAATIERLIEAGDDGLEELSLLGLGEASASEEEQPDAEACPAEDGACRAAQQSASDEAKLAKLSPRLRARVEAARAEARAQHDAVAAFRARQKALGEELLRPPPAGLPEGSEEQLRELALGCASDIVNVHFNGRSRSFLFKTDTCAQKDGEALYLAMHTALGLAIPGMYRGETRGAVFRLDSGAPVGNAAELNRNESVMIVPQRAAFMWAPMHVGYVRRVRVHGRELTMETLSTRPKVFRVAGLLLDKEADLAVSEAQRLKVMSKSYTASAGTLNDRTSSTGWLKFHGTEFYSDFDMRLYLPAFKSPVSDYSSLAEQKELLSVTRVKELWDLLRLDGFSPNKLLPFKSFLMHAKERKRRVKTYAGQELADRGAADRRVLEKLQQVYGEERGRVLYARTRKVREVMHDYSEDLSGNELGVALEPLDEHDTSAERREKTLFYSEMLQVVHYTEGQHYSAHVDAGSDPADPTSERYATLLFYLNTPGEAAGGGTNFPAAPGGAPMDTSRVPRAEINQCKHGVTAKPRKGDAILFYNLDEGTMRVDRDAMHVACDVLGATTDKWAANLWIHAPQSLLPVSKRALEKVQAARAAQPSAEFEPPAPLDPSLAKELLESMGVPPEEFGRVMASETDAMLAAQAEMIKDALSPEKIAQAAQELFGAPDDDGDAA